MRASPSHVFHQSALLLTLALLLLGCGGPSGPEVPEFVDVNITTVGTVTWEDGTPIVGAIVSSPLAFGYSDEVQATTGIHGTYQLAYRARCTPGGLVFNVNVRLPPQMANNGGSCTGAPSCSTGQYRRDCVFEFASGG
ncbi:MAG: hypothetical protein SFU84_06310 [Gemmatimonadales bacterium]|nr:hypothetical protein [Gemmatimonadales bacterium]